MSQRARRTFVNPDARWDVNLNCGIRRFTQITRVCRQKILVECEIISGIFPIYNICTQVYVNVWGILLSLLFLGGARRFTKITRAHLQNIHALKTMAEDCACGTTS